MSITPPLFPVDSMYTYVSILTQAAPDHNGHNVNRVGNWSAIVRNLRRVLLVTMLAVVYPFTGSAQEIQHFLEYNVQPDYWSFPGPIATDVDAGGDLNLAIPVMTIPGRGLDYEVVFTYKSSITFSEPSNWIGLGWNFNPGSITREVEAMGRRDNRDVPYHYGVDLFDDLQAPRRAPDVYYVTIPGRGTFEMTQINVPIQTNTTPSFQQGDFIITDHQPWLIETTATGPVTVTGTCEGSPCTYTTGLHRQGPNGGGFQAKTDISQFVVTVEDGTRYVFASPTLSTIDVPYHDKMSYLERQRYVSTWRLVSILGPSYPQNGPLVPTGNESGSWVRLGYGEVRTGVTLDHPFSPQIAQTQYLTAITTPLTSAGFTTVMRGEPNLPPHARNIQRRLQAISTPVETAEFSLVPLSPCKTSCRTGLREIAFRGSGGWARPGYTFEYDFNPTLLPDSDFFDQFTDDFGYYTSHYYQSNANQGGHAWSLTSIVHPTGAEDVITYETDHVTTNSLPYYNLSGHQEMYYVGTNRRWMGGARVTSITRDDGMGDAATSLYTYGPGRMSGIPPIGWQRMNPHWAEGGIRLVNRSNRGSSRVVYEWIETIEPDFSLTRRYFLTDTKSITGAEVHPVRAVFDKKSRPCEGIIQPGGHAPVLCEDRYVLQNNDHWNWGRLFKTEIHGPAGLARTEEEHPLTGQKHHEISLSWGTWNQPNHIAILFGMSQTRFSRVSEGGWETETWYEYDGQTNLLRETREVLRIAGGLTTDRVREITRAFSHYPEMRTRNMLSQIAREDVYEAPLGAPVRYHAADVTTWERPSGRTFWVPKRTFRWKADQPSTVKSSFTSWAGGTAAGWTETSVNEAFDAHGNVVQRRDARGTRISYLWGHSGSRLTAVTVHRGFATETEDIYLTLAYNNSWLKPSRICEASIGGSCSGNFGTATWFDYDAFGRLHSVRNNSGDTLTTYSYAFSRTAANNWTFDPNQPNATTITRFLATGASPAKSITRIFADGLARPIQTQARIGSNHIVTATDYDAMGRAVYHWKPYLDASAAGAYTPQYGPRATTWYRNYLGLGYNPNPFSETVYRQDRTSRVLATVAEHTQQAHSVLFDYGTETVAGQLLRYEETRDEDNRRTRQYFDTLGRMVRSIQGYGTPQVATTVFRYDLLDNLIGVTQPEGQQWTYTYDTMGRLTSSVIPDAGLSTFKYDRGGLLRFSQDGRQREDGLVTFTTYDFAGRPIVSGESLAPGGNLNPDSAYSFENQTTNWRTVWRYNGRPVTSAFPWNTIGARMNGYPTSRTVGRLSARAYRSGNQWQVELFSHDGDGRIETKSVFTQDIPTRDSRYDYALDLQGRLLGRTVQVGSSTFRHWYDYDELDRLLRIFASTSSTKPGTPDVTYTYHVSGQPASIRYQGQSQPLPHRYTIRDWLHEIGTPGTTTADWWYSSLPFHARNRYSASGDIDTLEVYQRHSLHAHKGYRYRLTYDDLGRLAGATYDPFTGSGFGTSSAYRVDNLTYDRNGNIRTLRRRNDNGVVFDNLTYTYETGRNRLVEVLDPSGAQYTWDAGRMQFDYDGSGNVMVAFDLSRGTSHSFAYDERNRPTHLYAYSNGYTITDYRYNADGQRYWKKTGTVAGEYYARDGATTLGVFGGVDAAYFNIVSPSGEVVGRRNVGLTWSRYYVKDHLGSTRVVLLSLGGHLEVRDYYPFGLQMPGRTSASGTRAKEGFTGHELDTESGMLYAGARYYMPAIGRWTSVDPLVHMYPSHSPYNYVLNNPLRLIDPDGRCVIEDRANPECVTATPQTGTCPPGIKCNEDEEEKQEEDVRKKYLAGEYEVIELGVPPELIGGVGRGARLSISAARRGWNWVRSRIGRQTVTRGITHNIDDLSRAAAAPDRNGLTHAGRALQKHSSRPGSAFNTSATRAQDLNTEGQSIVNNILRNPGSIQHRNRLGGIDVVAPNGRGIRFNSDGSFRGFLEPVIR